MIRAVDVTTDQPEIQSAIEPLLLEVADVVNTTLDLDTTLRRVAELVRKVIDYEIFAILLLNEKTQDLRFRFQVGYPKEVADRMRIKVGDGVTGLAAQRREAILVGDVSEDTRYISAISEVRSELAVPLIIKNRVIGVIDIESVQPDHFTEEHKQLLTLIASRVAVGIENARLYTRTTRQARTLLLLNEIARELTSILNLDQLLKRIAELLSRLIDYQMFSILLLDASGEKLQHRFSLRFQENIQLKHDVPLGKGIVGHAAQHKHTVLVPDVSKDPRYVLANPETRSELAVPLIYKDKVIGVLDLEHTRRGFFTDDHKRTVTTLAAQVAIASENARLYEQIERQEKRLERDLELARELYWHDDKIEIIEATGLPLGLFDDADYDEFTFNAKPGDKFVFFSDGILDARNEAGDLFGRSRVEQIVANSDGVSAEGLVNSLFDAVAEHAAGVETFDDQTVVVIKVKDGSGSL